MCYCYLSVLSLVPVKCFENKQLYFASKLNEAMKVVTVLFRFFSLKCGYFEGLSFFWNRCKKYILRLKSAILLQEHRIQSGQKFSYHSVASAAVVKLKACNL